MIKNLETILKNNFINLPGWKTNRKIVMFESDDWGMIRMASKEAHDRLLQKGYPVNKCPYNHNDSLESNNDMEGLMNVLSAVKDSNGNPAKFTLNNIVANPDFEKIRQNNFKQYYYEPFHETLKKYPGTDNVMALYKQGLKENIFQVQFHGREHLNINRWIKALQDGNRRFTDAFEENMFSVASGEGTGGRRDFLDAFGMSYLQEFETSESVINDGLRLFKDIWGFNSESFIAPCYIWTSDIERPLCNNGVNYIQGTHVQKVPKQTLELGIGKKRHYLGQKNKLGQRYMVRNVSFEPTEFSKRDNLAFAMNQIENAFKWKKPAIISSHRVNYIGGINKQNREKNLSELSALLNAIMKKYPDAEFLSTDQLGRIIDKKH